jgi:signal transduction histidine kinase
LSVVADVTERNAAAAIERFVSALEFIPQGIALWDSEQRLVHHNERYREILEPAGQEMVPGSSLEDLHRKIAASGIMEASIGREEAWVADRMREYQKADDDRRFQRLGRWHQRIYRRLPDGGLIFLVDDIHDTITAEEQLHQAQKMEAVGQLTGGIAHDFNNILAVMLGHLELAVDGLPESSKSVPMLDKAIAAAHRGAELVHRLLAFSANQALIPEIIDINKRLASMVEMMRRVFDETIEIIIKEAPEQLFCKVVSGQMETALLNLAINARDAMPDGGSLTVAVSETGLAVDDTDMAAGSYVTLTVSDTGTGMTDSVLSRVFEPFYTTKGQGKGTGLGLSMVYGFVKQSAGHITVHSEVGEGTRFKIHLPLCEASDGTSQTDIATEAHLRASESILLVEDDAALLDMASQLLQSLGYKVHVASDGPAACDVLDSGVRIDLLLTDVVLPKGMTGPDVAARAQKQYPDIKVLYMSGYNEHPILSSGAGHTMTLISKPFRKVQLANEVRLALGHGT